MDIAGYLGESFKIPLNSQQIRAICHTEGPGIVLAVAGSGKTTVLVSRTANLILNHGVIPENIYTMTFSRSAARDMESRFRKLFGDKIKSHPKFSTIHSFAYRLVSMVYRKSQNKITMIEGQGMNDKGFTKTAILGKLYLKHCNEYPTEEKLDQIHTLIGFVKNRRISSDAFDTVENIRTEKGFKNIFKGYEEYKRSKNLLDYDDLLIVALEILQNNRILLEKFRNQYPYIQVDEFQDTSPLQLEIINLLASSRKNLFVVGDDDQAIYEWRGTEPRIMMDFPKVYPDSGLYFMEENFRSKGEIIRLANKILTYNKARYEKKLLTRKAPGLMPRVQVEKNEKSQYKSIVDVIKKDGNSKDWAVLYRNNVSAIPLIKVLDDAGISFYFKDRNLKFFKHWVIRDIDAFITVAKDPKNSTAFSKIYYKNNAYISKELFCYGESMLRKRSSITSIFQGMLMYPHLKRYQGQKIEEMEEKFKKLTCLKDVSIAEYIEKTLGYGDFLKRKGNLQESSSDSGRGVLETLKDLTDGITSISEYEDAIKGFIKLLEKGKNNLGKGVTLSTLHAAKGLEFSNVYMIDLIDSIFPGKAKGKNPESDLQIMEEERRLFYVGVTRAKESLILSTMEQRFNEWTEPSVFLSEIRGSVKEEHWRNQWKTRVKEKIDRLGMTFKLHQRIQHRTFGEGVIVDVISQERITVDFKKVGKKTLLTHYLVDKQLLLEGGDKKDGRKNDQNSL